MPQPKLGSRCEQVQNSLLREHFRRPAPPAEVHSIPTALDLVFVHWFRIRYGYSRSRRLMKSWKLARIAAIMILMLSRLKLPAL